MANSSGQQRKRKSGTGRSRVRVESQRGEKGGERGRRGRRGDEKKGRGPVGTAKGVWRV
jgi:hypothetical protein